MSKINKYIICFFFIFFACEKIHYYPDAPLPTPIHKRILAHKTGAFCGYIPNTLEAAKHSLRKFDGIEVDVQLSSDNTIWLSHESKLPACGDFSSELFRESSDSRIAEIDSCLGPADDYTTLEEVFKFMADSFPDKYISIDAKAWKPADIKNMGIVGELNVVAKGIIELKNKYNLAHVMVETETATFLKYVKKRSTGIECYLTTFGDFDRGMLIALNDGFDGLSFEYINDNITADHIKLLHKKGLKIQLWTIYDENSVRQLLDYDADFVQTDLCNIDGFNR